MNWKTYLYAILFFNLYGFVFLFLLQMLQAYLPLNPEHLPGVSWHLSFNTAVSFVTNTNWQSYAGEITLSHLTQMIGLTTQNFASAAVGMAVLVALIRGIKRRSATKIEIADLPRGYILPPFLILALALVSQGHPNHLCIRTGW
jgi:K+-transporting ATPase ATPase A chain